MTTIVSDGKTISGDGMATGGYGKIEHDLIKVFKRKGNLYDVAGVYHPLDTYGKWIDNGRHIDQLPKDTVVMEVTRDGEVVIYDDAFSAPERSREPKAIGTGAQIALGAVRGGASTERAVAIASEYDAGTNDYVTTLGFYDNYEPTPDDNYDLAA